MPKQPPINELEFIKLTNNHAEFARKLQVLSVQSGDIAEYAQHVATCWYSLAVEHLTDARLALQGNRRRATYSRSYYAVYNASKAARYVISGTVSLKGDDHAQAATKLPQDIPDIAKWSERVTQLYECRLYADYDNWSVNVTTLPLTPEQAVVSAEEFLEVIKTYAADKIGLPL